MEMCLLPKGSPVLNEIKYVPERGNDARMGYVNRIKNYN